MGAGKTQDRLNALHDSYINGEMVRADYFAAVVAIHAQMSGYSNKRRCVCLACNESRNLSTKGTA